MKKRIRFNEVLEAEELREEEEANKVTESEQDDNKGKGKDADVKQEEIKRPSDDTFVSKEVIKASEVKTEDFDVKQKETEPHETNATKPAADQVKEDETIAEIQSSIPVKVEVEIPSTETPVPSEEPAIDEPSEEPEVVDVEETQGLPTKDGEANVCTDCPECLPLTKEIIESCKVTEDLDLSDAISTSKTITVNINGKTYAYEAESVADAKDVVYRFNKLKQYSKGRALSWLKKQVEYIGKAEPKTAEVTEETQVQDIPEKNMVQPEGDLTLEAVDAALFDIQQYCQGKGIRIQSKKNIDGTNEITIDQITPDKLIVLAQALKASTTDTITNAKVSVKSEEVTDSVKEDEEDIDIDIAPADDIPAEDTPTETPEDNAEDVQEDKDEIEVVIDAILNQDADQIESIQALIEKIKAIDEAVSLYRLEAEERDPKVVLAKVENGTTDIAEINEEGELVFNEIPTQFADIENVTPEILHAYLGDNESETPNEEPIDEPEDGAEVPTTEEPKEDEV